MAIFHERQEIVAAVVAPFTERQRKLFRLLCEDGLTAEDIAKEMGIEAATVRGYRHDLIKKIQKVIEAGDEQYP